MSATTTKVLVLNGSYEPMTICSAKKAFILVWLNKAEVLEHCDVVFRTVTDTYEIPSVIRVKTQKRVPYRRMQVSRRNIHTRDGWKCVYCGSKSDLTLDHIIPKSRGGGHSWKNLATACRTCNIEKGNRTPEEWGRKSLTVPSQPHRIINDIHGRLRDEWKPYLFMT